VVDNGVLATAFICTNTLDSTIVVGVEVFGPSGGAVLNDASTSSVAVAPAATVALATSGMATFSLDSALGLGALVSKGSARVLTTTSFKASQGVLCSAILADPVNSLPAVMTSLPVIRKTTQQGD
jgi:hypothetical protein